MTDANGEGTGEGVEKFQFTDRTYTLAELFPVVDTTPPRLQSATPLNGETGLSVTVSIVNGTVSAWLMDGVRRTADSVITNPGPKWQVKGLGHYNGDAKADILFQHDIGYVSVWLMDGLRTSGDGKSDVVFEDDAGTVSVWLMDGTAKISETIVADPGPKWHGVGNDGLRFISAANGNGTLAATSEDDLFVVTTYAAGPHAISGFNAAHDLIEFSRATFADFAAVQARITATQGGTVIALDATSSLTLQGVAPAALGAGDFRFV